jgi:hypothetical protein
MPGIADALGLAEIVTAAAFITFTAPPGKGWCRTGAAALISINGSRDVALRRRSSPSGREFLCLHAAENSMPLKPS